MFSLLSTSFDKRNLKSALYAWSNKDALAGQNIRNLAPYSYCSNSAYAW